jgi:hypothetical protein
MRIKSGHYRAGELVIGIATVRTQLSRFRERGTRTMKRLAIFSAAVFAMMSGAGASPASAQTFQSFTCSDGAQFTAAFLKYDPKQVHLQIDGKAVALKKRFTVTGSRYTGRGVSLTMNKSGTILRHGRRGPTRCTAM